MEDAGSRTEGPPTTTWAGWGRFMRLYLFLFTAFCYVHWSGSRSSD